MDIILSNILHEFVAPFNPESYDETVKHIQTFTDFKNLVDFLRLLSNVVCRPPDAFTGLIQMAWINEIVTNSRKGEILVKLLCRYTQFRARNQINVKQFDKEVSSLNITDTDLFNSYSNIGINNDRVVKMTPSFFYERILMSIPSFASDEYNTSIGELQSSVQTNVNMWNFFIGKYSKCSNSDEFLITHCIPKLLQLSSLTGMVETDIEPGLLHLKNPFDHLDDLDAFIDHWYTNCSSIDDYRSLTVVLISFLKKLKFKYTDEQLRHQLFWFLALLMPNNFITNIVFSPLIHVGFPFLIHPKILRLRIQKTTGKMVRVIHGIELTNVRLGPSIIDKSFCLTERIPIDSAISIRIVFLPDWWPNTCDKPLDIMEVKGSSEAYLPFVEYKPINNDNIYVDIVKKKYNL